MLRFFQERAVGDHAPMNEDTHPPGHDIHTNRRLGAAT